jgi:disulfide bond formation protein DsbB
MKNFLKVFTINTLMVFWDQIVIRVYSVLTLVGSLLILTFILDMIFGKISGERIFKRLWKHFDEFAVGYIFLVSVLATGGSLIFSELLNFTPCIMCWFQRIFMYPIALISGLAFFKKDKRIVFYSAALSIAGALLAAYHYLGQLNENTTLPCSAIGYSVSCSDSFFLQFGYITIPFMALTAFLLIFLAWFNSRD